MSAIFLLMVSDSGLAFSPTEGVSVECLNSRVLVAAVGAFQMVCEGAALLIFLLTCHGRFAYPSAVGCVLGAPLIYRGRDG